MFGIGLSPSYLVYSTDKTKIRIFAEYQFLLQAPFVKLCTNITLQYVAYWPKFTTVKSLGHE